MSQQDSGQVKGDAVDVTGKWKMVVRPLKGSGSEAAFALD